MFFNRIAVHIVKRPKMRHKAVMHPAIQLVPRQIVQKEKDIFLLKILNLTARADLLISNIADLKIITCRI